MDTDFKIRVEQVQVSARAEPEQSISVTVFHLSGWLDAQSEDQLLQAARKIYEKGARFILLNLKGVSTLTTAGMRSLQKIYKIYTPEGQQYKVAHVKICESPPQIYHVLGITGFLQNIPNYESQQAALDSFEG